ncbi:MAG: hypothetical protein HY916_03925 [Desulfovibrio sp.]|jgi:hypothetical protein|nr:hypothetical protein [Desulfovibrio sp.]
MTDEKKAAVQTFDLRHVTCGLVPAILDALAGLEGDEADVLVRAGIETEIINGFGTGGDWNFRFLPSFGHGLARFSRRPPDPAKRVRLDLLDY